MSRAPLDGHADSAPPHVARAGRRDVRPLVACGLCLSFTPSSLGLTCSCSPADPSICFLAARVRAWGGGPASGQG